jgi:hypothetical protein
MCLILLLIQQMHKMRNESPERRILRQSEGRTAVKLLLETQKLRPVFQKSQSNYGLQYFNLTRLSSCA